MRALRYLIFLIAMTCATGTSAAEIWPLKYEGKSTNDFIWDERTTTLVKLTIPDRFVDDLLAGLGGPRSRVHIREQILFCVSLCRTCMPSKVALLVRHQNRGRFRSNHEAWDEKPTLTSFCSPTKQNSGRCPIYSTTLAF